jgi:hypothetical protein
MPALCGLRQVSPADEGRVGREEELRQPLGGRQHHAVGHEPGAVAGDGPGHERRRLHLSERADCEAGAGDHRGGAQAARDVNAATVPLLARLQN